MLGEKLLCDRYVLEEKLGSGALGDLYRATDTQTNRAVAVRLVTEVRDPLTLATYYRQWAIQAGIRDENVGQILDIGEATDNDQRYPVVVTPLFDGTPLCDLFLQPLSNSSPIDWLKTIHRAALGVEKAHQRGLIHGRLHSGNIFAGRDGSVRVVDFGNGGVLNRQEGVASDIAALAALCFEALTGAAGPPADQAAGEAALGRATASTSEINRIIAGTLWPGTAPLFQSAQEFADALWSTLAAEGGGRAAADSAAPIVVESAAREEGTSNAPAAEAADSAVSEERVASGLKGLGQRMAAAPANQNPIADIERRAAEAADLGEAVTLLQEAAADHPDSPRLRRLITLYREKLDVVVQVLARTQQLEAEGKFDQAAEQREVLRSIHPAFRPDVPPVGSRPQAIPPMQAPPSAPKLIETVDLPDLSAISPDLARETREAVEARPTPQSTEQVAPSAVTAVARPQQHVEQPFPRQTELVPTPVAAAVAAPPEISSTPAEASPPVEPVELAPPEAAPSAGPQRSQPLNKAAEAIVPHVASLSASVRSQLEQLSVAERNEPASKAEGEIAEPGDNKKAPPRPKWIYIAGASVAALFVIGLAFLLSGGGSAPAVDVRQAEIRAYPPAAEILIDGEPCGTGECSAALEVGSHRATARLAGFEQEFQMFEIESLAKDSAKDAPPQRIELYLTALFPSLDVETDLAAGAVFLDDVEIGKIEDGAFSLRELPDGEHTVRVRSGTVEATLTIESAAGSAPLVKSLQSREAKVLAASSLAGAATFWTSAENIAVSVDGADKGFSSAAGLAVEGLQEGPHNVDGTGTTASFRADNQPRLALALNTDRNVGGLRIVTGQDGATVYLNDNPYRRKTSQGSLLVFLYPGSYRVRVEKPGFIASPEYTADVRKGARAQVDAELKPRPQLATLSIQGAPPGAQVRIDGEIVGETPGSGAFSYGAVRAGERVVQVAKAGYRTRTEQLQFSIGQNTSLDGSLVRSSGELTVAVTPANATALLVVRNSQGEIVQLENRRASLPEGGYRIEASANGFRSVTSDVRVVGGETVVAEIRFESLAPARPVGPQDLMSTLAADPAWSKQGDRLFRRGGEAVLLPAMGAGKYRFAVNIERGRRLQWMVNYVDESNYAWFQVGRDNFIRTVVSQGQRSKPVEVSHELADFRAVVIEIEVADNEIVHRLKRGGEWVELDRWKFTGADFAQGRFGFRLPGKDELSVASLTFSAR